MCKDLPTNYSTLISIKWICSGQQVEYGNAECPKIDIESIAVSFPYLGCHVIYSSALFSQYLVVINNNA